MCCRGKDMNLQPALEQNTSSSSFVSSSSAHLSAFVSFYCTHFMSLCIHVCTCGLILITNEAVIKKKCDLLWSPESLPGTKQRWERKKWYKTREKEGNREWVNRTHWNTHDHIHKYTESSLDFPTLASAGENKKKIQWTPEKTTSSAA